MDCLTVSERFSYVYGPGQQVSECRLEVWVDPKGDVYERSAVVIASERADNPGASITNTYERLALAVYTTYLMTYSANNILWFEHYPQERLNDKETFDSVTLHLVDGFPLQRPVWHPSTREVVEMSIGGKLKLI